MIEEYIEKVRPIVERVREEGDRALIEFTERFDGVRIESVRIEREEFEDAYDSVSDELIDALEVAKENIERFHYITMPDNDVRIDFDYAIMGKRYVPIDIAGLYIPGGRASYPSTVLMAAVPAKLAGVGTVVACTPPNEEGRVNPLTLVAMDMCGVDEVYRVGGAQAIAAMAYGTETVKKVDKIVGPGNIYVTAAKLLVQKDVAIDMPAGPSEVLVIADESADAQVVALECLAQLEHDPLARAFVVTTSRALAEDVERLVRSEFPEANLECMVVESIKKAVEVSNEVAPEHLVILTENYWQVFEKVRHAGSVFLGEYSPVAAGDYASGTNHILPTARFARMYSGVGVETFMKSITYQELRKEGLERISQAIIRLARAEGLEWHAKSVEERLK
ncbi:histidinol dehydrogenase [Geoglobus ahangari]|uniref:histidinol dehydrogenase n=1 Tax=Geoglobus ahangari TaxID=113653 RepID=UPI00064FD432|nr:histidinol dehydrogenase [Geoglobus ahangari]